MGGLDYVFLADKDASDDHTKCVRLQELETAAKAVYYTTKTLVELRRRLGG